MTKAEIQHVTIVGVGLLGGSIGLALKAAYPSVRIAGVGRRMAALEEARQCGAIDTVHLDVGEAVGQSDLAILATPVGAFEAHLRAIKPLLKAGAWVTDVGSTKAQVVALARRVLGAGSPFIGSHPMAGSERKGVRYASARLLAGATCVITPVAATPPALATRARRLWETLGMKVIEMTPRAHDQAVARVSHLPHILAGLLMLLPRDADLALAATGLRDTTRLAGGDSEMWRDILLSNRTEILAAMDTFGRSMQKLRALIEQSDAAGIERLLVVAKKRRDAAFPR